MYNQAVGAAGAFLLSLNHGAGNVSQEQARLRCCHLYCLIIAGSHRVVGSGSRHRLLHVSQPWIAAHAWPFICEASCDWCLRAAFE